VLLQEGELKWWNYFQSEIPTDAAAELGVTTWQDRRLEPAFKFLVGTVMLGSETSRTASVLTTRYLANRDETFTTLHPLETISTSEGNKELPLRIPIRE
jgi:hypothetical protein